MTSSFEGFRLILKSQSAQRTALFDALTNVMVWEDNGSPVFPFLENGPTEAKVHAISPGTPGLKTTALNLIKVQIGVGCNMKCGYCSQAGMRATAAMKKISLEHAQAFLEGIHTWYDGGRNGLGKGTRLEFWGGETLIYWKTVKALATDLRRRYPDLDLLVFSNGTLFSEEVIETAANLRIHMAISHDGPGQMSSRGRDPLAESLPRKNIKKLFDVLAPLGLVSFNSTITAENHSLTAIHRDIAQRLETPFHSLRVGYELFMPYDSAGSKFLFKDRGSEIRTRMIHEALSEGANGLLACSLHEHIARFRSIIAGRMPAAELPQHCGMDMPNQIAVGLDGRVLTCQNTTSESGHQIGHVSDLESVRLTTSFHWSRRPECIRCPVVSFCQGACMFLKDDLWEGACNQFFEWSLGLLTLALYFETGMLLEKVRGAGIRGHAAEELVVLTSEDLLNLLPKAEP